jgi:hypothetical protein
MTCDELLKALNDYIDDETVLAFYTEFADHLAGCNPCQVVVDNVRKTIKLYQNCEPYPMPAEFEQRLSAELKLAWQRKFQRSASPVKE